MKGNNLCTDIGYIYLNHEGEQLCGDHVEIVDQDNYTVVVLADGLGSGVKANILSTLTAKIISTMVAAGMELEYAVETIIATLPVCSVREIAYSTFTVICIENNEKAELVQYDNPPIVLLRDGKYVELDGNIVNIRGKEIHRSSVRLQKGDVFIVMSDGVEHAGIGRVYNFGWKHDDIIDFMETFWDVGFTAKTLAGILIDETNKLYDGMPGDDATVCIVKIRTRNIVNLLIGPPSNPDDCDKMISLFFSKEGKHIVSGGTTSIIASEYLNKPIRTNITYLDPQIPPTGEIEGVDLVTEGIITFNRVLEYAQNYLEENKTYDNWIFKKDGASQIARMLFEDATDINFFVGCAVNPAHQNPNLPINFNIKMKLVEEISHCLRKMGKKVELNYF